MARTWAVAGVMVLVTGSMVMAQERVAPAPEVIAKLKREAMQLPLAAKMRVPLEAKVVTGAPYSADVITESIETLADGNRIVNRTTGRVYRDGQGRVRREDERPGQPASVTIIDPVAGVSYALEPEAKVAWKTQADGKTVALAGSVVAYAPSAVDPADVERKRVIEEKIRAEVVETKARSGATEQTIVVRAEPAMKVARGGPAWDVRVEQLPAKQIEGVSAQGTRTTRTIPAGAIGNERPIVMVTEEWRSTELQILVLTTTSDPRTGESTYRLSNIVRAEPDPGFFEVPAGYTLNDTNVRKNVIIKRDEK